MRRAFFGASTAVCAILLSIGLPLGTAQAAPTAQSPVTDINKSACPAYILYAVRGTLEDPGPKHRSLKELLGPRIGPVYKELQATVGASLVGAVANTYPAAAVTYGPSVNQGVVNAETDIVNISSKCQGSMISLVGYSQGADVLRRALSALGGQYDIVRQLHIYGTYFFGDPNFDPNEVGTSPELVEHGDFEVTAGIGRVDPLLSPPPALPSTGIVHSYCDALDVVCQGVSWADNGFTTHFTYADKYAKGVAWRIAAPGNHFLKPIPLAYIARSAPLCQGSSLIDVQLSAFESYLPVPFAIYVDSVRVYNQTLPGTHNSPPMKVAVSGASPLVEVDSSGSIIDQVKVRSSC